MLLFEQCLKSKNYSATIFFLNESIYLYSFFKKDLGLRKVLRDGVTLCWFWSFHKIC